MQSIVTGRPKPRTGMWRKSSRGDRLPRREPGTESRLVGTVAPAKRREPFPLPYPSAVPLPTPTRGAALGDCVPQLPPHTNRTESSFGAWGAPGGRPLRGRSGCGVVLNAAPMGRRSASKRRDGA